jgi:hypothetical protein
LLTVPALPHLAAGASWTTGIYVMNTADKEAAYSIAFRDDSGNSVALPFTTGAAGLKSSISGTLPASGSMYFEAGGAQAPLAVAWGQITAESSIVVHGLFRNNVNGTYYEAGVPSSQGSKGFVIPFDGTTFAPANAPTFTGIAVANLDSTTAAKLTCTARNTNGAVIANGVTVPSIPALGHWADYQFPALSGQRGTIDCTSNTNVTALALRFIGTTAFSSLPVVQK